MLSPSRDLPPNVRVASAIAADDARFDVTSDRAMRALAEAENRHFWHRARCQFIADELLALGVAKGSRVLDLGCGGGAVAAHLANHGWKVTGVDGQLSLVRAAALRAPTARFVVHDLSRGTATLGEHDYDAACLFDVIEHLDDPRKAIEDALSTVAPGGLVAGTVPALMSLWSDVDVQAGHRLRYDDRTLWTMLEGVRGGRTIEVKPFFRALVPVLWVQRRLVVKRGDVGGTSEANFRVPPAPLNRALYALVRLEARASRVLDRTPLPGASLWFVVRRR